MNLGSHAEFIIAAYVIAMAVIGALVVWVVLDYRAQKILLADLNARGTSRCGRDATPAANVEPA